MKANSSSLAAGIFLLAGYAFADGVHIPEPVGGFSNPPDRDEGITFGSALAITPTVQGLLYDALLHEFAGEIAILDITNGNEVWLAAVGASGEQTLLINNGVRAAYFQATDLVLAPAFPTVTLNYSGVSFGSGSVASDTTLARSAAGVLQINGQNIVTQNNLSNYVTLTGAQTLSEKTFNSPAVTGTLTVNGAPAAVTTGAQTWSGEQTFNATARFATSSSTAHPSVFINNNTGSGLFLTTFGSTEGGTSFGLSRNNMSLIESQSEGPMVVGTSQPGRPLALGTAGVERLRIDAYGNFGFGTATPSGRFSIVGNGQTNFDFDSYSDLQYQRGSFNLRRARGTVTSPADVVIGDIIGDYSFFARNNGNYQRVASMSVLADGTMGSVYVPGKIGFSVSDGVSLAQEKMAIFGDGKVGIGTSSPGAKLHAVAGNTATTGAVYGIRGESNIESAASSSTAIALWGQSRLASTATGANTGAVFGVQGVGRNDSTAYTLSSATGVQGAIMQAGSGGSITTGNALVAASPTHGGTGTIATANGLLLNQQKVSGVGTGYGVNQQGANDLNYFAGSVGIGVNPPTVKLDVSGSVKISGSLTVAGNAVVTSNQLSGYQTTNSSGASLTHLNAGALTGTVPVEVMHSSVTRLGDSVELGGETTGELAWGRVDKTDASLADLPVRNFSSLQNLPATLAEHGITDAVTAASLATQLSSYQTTNSSGASLTHLNAGALTGTVPVEVMHSSVTRLGDSVELGGETTGELAWGRVNKTNASLADLSVRDFASLQNLPATLAEHGITDAIAVERNPDGHITTAIRITPQGDISMGLFGPPTTP